MPAAIIDDHFRGRIDFGNLGHEPIGRRDDQTIILRNHPFGVAKEGEYAERQQQ